MFSFTPKGSFASQESKAVVLNFVCVCVFCFVLCFVWVFLLCVIFFPFFFLNITLTGYFKYKNMSNTFWIIVCTCSVPALTFEGFDSYNEYRLLNAWQDWNLCSHGLLWREKEKVAACSCFLVEKKKTKHQNKTTGNFFFFFYNSFAHCRKVKEV